MNLIFILNSFRNIKVVAEEHGRIGQSLVRKSSPVLGGLQTLPDMVSRLSVPLPHFPFHFSTSFNLKHSRGCPLDREMWRSTGYVKKKTKRCDGQS